MSPALSDRFLAWWWRRGWRGFQTLLRLRGSDRLNVRTPFGSVFALDPVAYIDGIVLREGFYEAEVFAALQPYLGTGAVFWDIGANFGLHSVTAKVVHPVTQVVAFEANPAMVREIEANARLNGVRVDTVALALAESAGPRIFHINERGNAGMSSLHASPDGHLGRQISVACARGDDLVSSGKLPAPTVIKLNVEGGEAGVLAGLGALLSRPGLRAVVFAAARGLENAPAADPVAGRLHAAGFTFAPLVRREPRAHPLGHYLALRAA